MRRGELSPTAAAGRGLLRSDLGLPPHDMKASASLPALIPNGVHKNATIGTIAVPKNSLKFKIPGEGRRSRPGGVKHKNKSGKVSQATLNHALHRIESEEAMLMARLTSLGKPNAKLVATAGPPAAALPPPLDLDKSTELEAEALIELKHLYELEYGEKDVVALETKAAIAEGKAEMHGYWTSDRPPIYALSPEGGGGAAGAINIWDAEKKGSKVKASRAYAGATPSPPKLIPRRVRSMPKLPPLGRHEGTRCAGRCSGRSDIAGRSR